MKNIWILGVLIVIAVIVLYPKSFGSPLCGPICPPSGLSAEKQQCIGFEMRKNYIDGFTDLCFGVPYGEKTCYGVPHGSPSNTQAVELPCDYPNSVGNFVFFEKNTGWSECQSGDVCSQAIKIWSGGLMEYIGQRNEKINLSNSDVNRIIQLINDTGVLTKMCEAEYIIADRRTTYTFHPREKMIVYPACEQELEQIDVLIEQITAAD